MKGIKESFSENKLTHSTKINTSSVELRKDAIFTTDAHSMYVCVGEGGTYPKNCGEDIPGKTYAANRPNVALAER